MDAIVSVRSESECVDQVKQQLGMADGKGLFFPLSFMCMQMEMRIKMQMQVQILFQLPGCDLNWMIGTLECMTLEYISLSYITLHYISLFKVGSHFFWEGGREGGEDC